MCFKEITKRVILKKRLPVWGVVRLKDGEYSPFGHTSLNDRELAAEDAHFNSGVMKIGSFGTPKYDSVFHKFVDRKDAAHYRRAHYILRKRSYMVIRRFFFPRGEEVLYGTAYNFERPMVGCKKMINPRVKAKEAIIES